MGTTPAMHEAWPRGIVSACDAAIRRGRLPGAPPEILYHLTDAEALIQILSTRRLRASLATVLNDASEVHHGIDIAKALVQDRLRRQATPYESALSLYLEDPAAAPQQAQFELYPVVISFCRDVDRSGQWMHYGRSGRGVAIGIASSIAACTNFDLDQVDYDLDSQRRRMRRLLDAGARSLTRASARGLAPSKQNQLAVLTAHVVSLYVSLLAVQMKHPAFACEDEWRMSAFWTVKDGRLRGTDAESSPVKFRQVGDRVVPYEDVDFATAEPNPVREIVLGHESPISAEAMRVLLVSAGTRASVRRSQVPVR